MSETERVTEGYDEPGLYEIRIKGHLADWWGHLFEGMTITLEEDSATRLTGPVIDQAALYGLLRKVRDVGMPLLSVNRLNLGEANRSGIKL